MAAMARTVVTPDGIAWTVKRRWMPHRKVRWRRMGKAGHETRTRGTGRTPADDRWYGHFLDLFDLPSVGDLGDLGTAISVIVGVIAAALLLWFLVIPALLLLVDLVVVILVALAGLLAHVVLRRPWEVEASCGDRRLAWLVAGSRPSREKVAEVAASLTAGVIPTGSVTP